MTHTETIENTNSGIYIDSKYHVTLSFPK